MTSTAQMLYDSAKKLGLGFVLGSFGENIKVRIPLSDSFCMKDLTALSLSVRSQNGLMRNSALKVGDVYRIIMSESGLSKVRNLGRKSVSEIKTMMLAMGYDQLTDRERLVFWQDFVQLNNLPAEMSLDESDEGSDEA